MNKKFMDNIKINWKLVSLYLGKRKDVIILYIFPRMTRNQVYKHILKHPSILIEEVDDDDIASTYMRDEISVEDISLWYESENYRNSRMKNLMEKWKKMGEEKFWRMMHEEGDNGECIFLLLPDEEGVNIFIELISQFA